MKHRFTEQTAADNLLEAIPAARPVELFDILTEQSNLRIERIVSWGQVTAPGAWYDQEWSEWVLLLQGAATLRLERSGLQDLHPGSWLLLPAHCRHRVEFTSSDPPAIWLAVHFRDA